MGSRNPAGKKEQAENEKRVGSRNPAGIKEQEGKEDVAAMEWIKFLAGAALLLLGAAIFLFEMIGVFRFRYVLNRMHAAAMGDTLGIGCCILGLIVMNGPNLASLKLFLVIVFLWFSSPVSSHLIARLEVTTDEEGDKHYRRIELPPGKSSAEQEEREQ